MASLASIGGGIEPVAHGGDIAAARRLFPGAPEPFIDLSTGINPYPYPLPRFPGAAFSRLPSAAAADALVAAAARRYGAPSVAHVVAAPGTQVLLPLVAALVRPGPAAILVPTYGEFARAAALAGHDIMERRDLAGAAAARLVFVANPNNPDGRLFGRDELIGLADRLRRNGGLLVVDEAFIDGFAPASSLAADVACGNVVVLRSFGKFFGLAGVRLGFAIAAPALATRLSAQLGPWAVSGPALMVGVKALTDGEWIAAMRRRLAERAGRLDAVLTGAGLEIVGGTALFRLTRAGAARAMFEHLGRAGILVRIFAEAPNWLRFGLPANERALLRLKRALAAFRRSG